MIRDAYLELADGQESTVSVASTNYIDTLAKADMNVGDWFLVRVDTAFVAAAGQPHAKFQLQTAAEAVFTATGVTLAQSATFQAAALTADTVVFKVRIPPGTLRYIRGYMVCRAGQYGETAIADANKFNAGTFDITIVKDADINMQLIA